MGGGDGGKRGRENRAGGTRLVVGWRGRVDGGVVVLFIVLVVVMVVVVLIHALSTCFVIFCFVRYHFKQC